jgi:predicted GNAT family acetyltransferase
MIHDVTEISLSRVQAFLEKYIETSLFLLSNLAEIGYCLTDHLNSGNYKYTEVNGEIESVFCLTRRGNLLAQTGGRADLAETILRACETEPISIQGVVGEWTIADAIWKTFCANPRFNPTYTSHEALFSMEIASANVPTFETKGVRALAPNDFDEWVKPNTDYLVEEGLPVQGTIAERKAQFVDQTKAGYWWGAFDNKQLVATAALNAIYGTIGQVGGVYTVPEKRRRGLARSAMLLLLNDSKNRHHLKKIILFTGEQNFAATKLYESLGFTAIGHFGLLFGKWKDELGNDHT